MKQIYNKDYYTIPQQIQHLKHKGLIFADEQQAEHILKHISYYRLSGYFYHFQDRQQGNKFVYGITFENIIALYKFDAKLRLLIMGALESIEVSLRTAIIRSMGGCNTFAFNTQDIFNFKRDSYEKFQSSRIKNWQRSQEQFKQHFDSTYKLPPVWVEVETWTMGTIRDFVNSIERENQIKIVRLTHFKTPDFLVGWIKNLTTLRNICAHHGRLWNKTLNNIEASNKGFGDLHILFQNSVNAQRNDINIHPNNRLYYYCMIIWYILQHIIPASDWNQRLQRHIGMIPKMPAVSLINMGFPDNWCTEPYWRL